MKSIKETQQVKTSWEIQERRVVTDTVKGKTNVKGENQKKKGKFRRVIHISTTFTNPLKRMAASCLTGIGIAPDGSWLGSQEGGFFSPSSIDSICLFKQ